MHVRCRLMKWHAERMEHRDAGDGEDSYGDHFDGSNWKEMFCKDPQVAANGGPDKSVAILQHCSRVLCGWC